MKNLTIDLPDDVCKVAAQNLGWTTTVKDVNNKDIANPQASDDFLQDRVIQFIKDNYTAKKTNDASAAAVATATTAAAADVANL